MERTIAGSNPAITIRAAGEADVEAVAAIYNEGIRGRMATYETAERSGADVRGWLGGDALMRAFIPACERAGLWKVLSRIFPENGASRALCARHGFREVGTYEKHAQLDGVWRDVVIVERVIPGNLR